jgi:neutral ceramidase
MIRAGLAAVDVTVYDHGQPLLGWARPGNVALGVAEPLTARALVLRDDGGDETLALVSVDLCFVSESLRRAVLARLGRRLPRAGLDERTMALTATHTHSGPSGFAPELYYSLAGAFSPRVHDTLADGIAEAVARAHARLEPARLRLAAASLDAPIAWNRGLRAWARNDDLDAGERRAARRGAADRALDRTHTLLRVEDLRGRAFGAVSVFPLHGTCVHGDQTVIHPDHKGLAAAGLEVLVGARAEAGDDGTRPDLVALFLQGAAGDVTPNPRWSPQRGFAVGPGGDDDLAHARRVADAQARHALELLAHARGEPELRAPAHAPTLAAAAAYVELARMRVADDLADGASARDRARATTTSAVLGVAMAHGTDEGPGPLHRWRDVTCVAAALRRAGGLDPKLPLAALGDGPHGRLLGALPVSALAAVGALARGATSRDPGIARLLGWAAAGALGPGPFVPERVPVQVLRIGPLAIAAIAAEPTTRAGARLRGTLGATLRACGVRHALVLGYANSYSGYVVTPEEYEVQRYEGGYTLFGPLTLAAHRTALREVARRLAAPAPPRDVPGPRPPPVDDALLARRASAPSAGETGAVP